MTLSTSTDKELTVFVNGKEIRYSAAKTKLIAGVCSHFELLLRSSDIGSAVVENICGPEFDYNSIYQFFEVLTSNSPPAKWREIQRQLSANQQLAFQKLATRYNCPGIFGFTPTSQQRLSEHLVLSLAMQVHRLVSSVTPHIMDVLFNFDIYDIGRVLQVANRYNKHMLTPNVQSDLAAKLLEKSKENPIYYYLFQFVSFSLVRVSTFATIMTAMKDEDKTGRFVPRDLKDVILAVASVRKDINSIISLDNIDTSEITAKLPDRVRPVFEKRVSEEFESLRGNPVQLSSVDIKEIQRVAKEVIAKAKAAKARLLSHLHATSSTPDTETDAKESLMMSADIVSDLLSEGIDSVKITLYPAALEGFKYATPGFVPGEGESPWPSITFHLAKKAFVLGYTIECNAELGYLRSWSIDGWSKETESWIEIDRHTGTEELLLAGQKNMPPPEIKCSLMTTPFNVIRLVLRGLNTRGYRRLPVDEIKFRGLIVNPIDER